MVNKSKSIIPTLVVLIFALFLMPLISGCASRSPEGTVAGFFKAIEDRDFNKAKSFISTKMQGEVGDDDDAYGEMTEMPMGDINYTMVKNAGKDAGGMMAMDGPQFDGVPAHWMLYFAVEDCDKTAAKVAATGGQIRVPPTQIPVGKFSAVCDPQGAGFSIITVTNTDC